MAIEFYYYYWSSGQFVIMDPRNGKIKSEMDEKLGSFNTLVT